MVLDTKLKFSKFQPQEFEKICQLLCTVFETSQAELLSLYQSIDSTFDQPGWPLHFVNREFFKPEDLALRETYQKSPVIAVDLPSLMELDDGQENKPTVAIIGQDSKHNRSCEQIVVGTPYGLHHKGSREILRGTKFYFEMIKVLLELGYRVYLTDLFKVWICNPNKPFYGIQLPKAERQRFAKIIEPELSAIQPATVITWGKEMGVVIDNLQLNTKHLNFIHPSGAASGAWKKLLGKSPTDANKLEYWKTVITQEMDK